VTAHADLIEQLRAAIVASAGESGRIAWLKQLDRLDTVLKAEDQRVIRLRQDVEDAEHDRDAEKLLRMRVVGQLNTLHKTIEAATPAFEGDDDGEPQHVALRRIEWLARHAGTDPAAMAAAREEELNAPMPGQIVLEAVIAGERQFTKAQLEFSLSEAMVLCGWELTPLEIMQKGEAWLAKLLLDHHSPPDAAES
jgi:acetyl/propionyl-CoA carboxylase alpha subunit